jgi:hypothetical protein
MLNQPWTLGDENHQPLPQGTVVEFPSQMFHQAIVAYNIYGQQMLLEKTWLHGKPTVTNPEAYRGVSYHIARRPRSAQHSVQIVNRALAEIQEGKQWTIFDNCQDFVSRVYDGKNGSKTRDIGFGLLAMFGLVGLVLKSA